MHELGGRHIVAALLAAASLYATPLRASDALVVETRKGVLLGEITFDAGQELCLSWAHSVTGGAVADCFENKGGQMILTRSYLHDFAAGLGEIEGRGTLRSAQGGGYWIDGIDEQVHGNALHLQVGAPRVDHKLRGQDRTLHLSAMAAGSRLTLRLKTGTP
jgi:hypothetical protein